MSTIYEKMKNIADAIRIKTSKSELMNLDEMAQEILSIRAQEIIQHAEIPEYVKQEVRDLADRISQVKKENSIVFLAMSDMHYYDGQKDIVSSPDQNGIQTDISNLHAAMAAKILAYMFKIDFMAYLGDATWGHATTPPDILVQQAKGTESILKESHENIPCFHAIGNHDTGIYYDEEQTETDEGLGAEDATGNDGNFIRFTNALRNSIDTTGEIYNGKGYKENTRYSTSSNVETDFANWDLSGYIKIQKGDILRFKNLTFFDLDGTGGSTSRAQFYMFDSSFNYVTCTANYSPSSPPSAAWEAVYGENGDLIQCTFPTAYGSDIAYIRFGAKDFNENSIVTVNEKINNSFMLSGKTLFDLYTKLSDSDDTVFGDSTYGGYCYRDFPDKKLRVFLLNTSEAILYQEQTGLWQPSCIGTQRKWLAESLINLNEKSDASEWQFIILSHYPADFGSTMTLSELIRAYKEGTSLAISLETGGTYNANFASKNSAKLIAQFHGHIHNFLTSKLYTYVNGSGEQYWAQRIAIPNCCYNRENYYDTIGGYTDISFKEEQTYLKTPNSAKDTSFVVNIINPDEEMIYSLCYGAGRDRAVSYKEVTFYSILNDLDKITNSNSLLSIEESSSYNATLIPQELYEISSIKITMGGVDITNSVYSNGEITIPSVTGDIVIKAVAVRPLASVNQIPISTDKNGNIYNYKSGVYINSAGTESSHSASSSTGFIPYNIGDEVRLYDVGLTYGSANQSYNRIIWYDANKNYLGSINTASTYVLQTQGGGILNDQNEWVYFTLQLNNANNLTNSVAYIRISAERMTPHSVITINEEIKYMDEVADISYSVTTNLTNMTSTNPSATLSYGEEYYTKITVNEGKYFGNISVQMGAKDITSEVYNASTGEILIKRVYDNIVVTGAGLNYQNQIPISTDTDGSIYNGIGYKSGYYISSSGGALSSRSSSYVTGFIPCKVGDIVRLQNVNFDSDSDDKSYHRVAFYDSSKTYIGLFNGQSVAVPDSSVQNSEGIWTRFGIKATMGGTDYSSVAYFRLCCSGISSNSIITINETIE